MAKILIANRGEIACRVIKSCHDNGHLAVAVYSDADEGALHTELADEAVNIGPAKAADSYLRTDKILEVAKKTGADAIHPGYGFLAENPTFADQVEKAGLVWIGPHSQTIVDMGDKERARELARAAGVPILPGSARFQVGDLDGIEEAAQDVGYPLLVKASAGGGGIGMRLVEEPSQLLGIVESTQTMAERSFGDGTVFLERFVKRARHIEIQIFGFGNGEAVHFYERECSIQRRFQKIVEEAPAPNLPRQVRDEMADAAVALAKRERYRGAGTVEFVYDDEKDEYFFLEMNTRIQVEHPVSEETTDSDLVGLQIALALGQDLRSITQDKIVQKGHSIECRLYAENPNKMFLPSPGTLEKLDFAKESTNVRIETGVRQGSAITPYYDPMIAKLIAVANDRVTAIKTMEKILSDTELEGVMTNIAFLKRIMKHNEYLEGKTFTGFVDAYKDELID